ncbi:hypothetical protein SIID45300_02380 [Candidatus Magnetaquicoccaceae bacterium FCR-1]|uniref:Uncharacterized protein n=1 Tax=Candidatus Magnetaquiglobus chichijimensis TaxID=3141448 RepID=A0ABQ0CBG9_9PROT
MIARVLPARLSMTGWRWSDDQYARIDLATVLSCPVVKIAIRVETPACAIEVSTQAATRLSVITRCDLDMISATNTRITTRSAAVVTLSAQADCDLAYGSILGRNVLGHDLFG